MAEINPEAILPPNSGRRSLRNRPKVDYASAEAHAKAGIDPNKDDDEE